MPNYKLISFELCPFVQRSTITLEEKQVPYAIEFIDIYDKPAWFLELSPLGKVPILLVDGEVLFESAAINEYIDESAPGPRLLPRRHLHRAKHRAWVAVAAQLIGFAHRMTTARDEQETRKHAGGAHGLLEQFEEAITGGPLFSGKGLSLVDAAAAPALQRLTWCLECEPSLAVFDDLPRVQRWRDALLERESVRRSTVPGVRELFFDYLRGRGPHSRSAEPTWLGERAPRPDAVDRGSTGVG